MVLQLTFELVVRLRNSYLTNDKVLVVELLPQDSNTHPSIQRSTE